jgi:hypothetical protein
VAYVKVEAGDVLFLPPNVIHFVLTGDDQQAAALGTNFLIEEALEVSTRTYLQERADNVDPDHCFPQFEAVIVMTIWLHFNKCWAEGTDENFCPALKQQLLEAWNAVSSRATVVIVKIAEHVSFYTLKNG